MGTNYYLHKNPCPHCQRPEEVIHIGKSSVGWAFALHVIPGEIDSLDDWEELWRKGTIMDEYGETLTSEEMLEIIKDRPYARRHDYKFCFGHGSGPWDYVAGEFS